MTSESTPLSRNSWRSARVDFMRRCWPSTHSPAKVAAMAGIAIPIEPRKRFNWVIQAETPLDRPLPLTIDPSGVFVREVGGGTYMAGGHADVDPAVDFGLQFQAAVDELAPESHEDAENDGPDFTDPDGAGDGSNVVTIDFGRKK